MRDQECVDLLQWMLPLLHMRWTGFRRVRKQVCKRLSRRLRELGLRSATDYRRYLEANPQEWAVADSLLRVTISRFYRDRGMFAYLGNVVLPGLGAKAMAAGRKELLAWSAGCASGEEPYSLALLWHFEAAARLPRLTLRILGTDVDEHLLLRAQQGCYPPGCLKDLPERWRLEAFDMVGTSYRLKARHMSCVAFQLHDLRAEPPAGPFDLVLCRNLAFTYFDRPLQLATGRKLSDRLRAGGALVLGAHERLPAPANQLTVWCAASGVYRKRRT